MITKKGKKPFLFPKLINYTIEYKIKYAARRYTPLLPPNIRMKNHQSFLYNTVQIIAQVVLLSLIWLLANWLSQNFIPALPASILGLFILLLGFLLGLPLKWFSFGAYWLITHMLLFFIPALISVIQYQEVIIQDGLKIIFIIFSSTLLVMATTALVVDFCYRQHVYHKRKKRLNHSKVLP